MKQGWYGQAYNDLLWRAASATNVRDFEKCMLKLKTMNPKAHEWLNKILAEHWARSHFSGRAKSDLLLNNICEVFNSKIVEGRDKPVITLLEYIREYCMKRIVNVQGSLGDQCVVDVVSMTCSCRKWELIGIPCRPRKKRKRSKHEDEQFVKDGKLARKEEPLHVNHAETLDIIRQHVKDKVERKQQCSASRQAQQTEPAVGQDGSGGSGVGAVIECKCGLPLMTLTSWTRDNPARRFGVCPNSYKKGIRHRKRWYWNDSGLENKWYRTQLYEMHLLLNPSQREELENELTSREELAVL
ncbi:hypothetical protein Tco_0619473 [Tanacetum coccineum]